MMISYPMPTRPLRSTETQNTQVNKTSEFQKNELMKGRYYFLISPSEGKNPLILCHIF